MLGLPERFKSTSAGGGVIQDTASSSTLCALLAARERATGFDVNEHGANRKLIAYCSNQAHSSVEKAVKIAGLKRELPKIEVMPGVTIAILNILGDTELVLAAAKALTKQFKKVDYDVMVTAEAKSIPLIHALSVETKKPYVVLRKTYKPYMGAALEAETMSITTNKMQTLYLDEKDHALINGKKVMLVDDVVSTGSTQKAMRAVVEKAGAEIAAEAAILTEGSPEKWEGILSLGNLPVWVD
ncbi:MAG: adenine phosphoribosyltransferase [Chloroflexi bacterium]|nr:adenine phosphoribosyltransferase [Chloroflexota bacterium]